jgi:predicted  nucleic acid-binding Zn-ribbon protein
MSQTFKLYRLQQLDSQLDQGRKRVSEIDRALSDNQRLRNAEMTAQVAATALENVQKKLRKAELDVQSQKLKIEQTEATLYGGKVRNPKELQDLENESAALRRYLEVLEERQLEAMLTEEECQENYDHEKSNLDNVSAETSDLSQQLTAEKRELEKTIARLEGERKATVKSISEPDLGIYEQLRKKRRGIAVALVSENFCSACGSTLSAAELYEARSPNSITRCESCGRLLYAG